MIAEVLSHVEGHFLTGYADGGDAPDKHLGLVPGAGKDALAFLEGHPDTKARFDRVAELVQGFETPFGLELLATVHWVAAHDGAHTVDEAVGTVYEWNDRKRVFEPRQIQLASDVLGAGAGFARSPLRRERCLEAESATTDLWQARKPRSKAIVRQRTRLQPQPVPRA
jgi:hypothetical protein